LAQYAATSGDLVKKTAGLHEEVPAAAPAESNFPVRITKGKWRVPW
jgi:hypothetical protein